MIVKTKKRKKVRVKKPRLTIPEQVCLEALQELTTSNGGKIPSLAEIAEKMGNVVQVPHVSKLKKRLEEKGYYSERAEVAS